MKVAFCIRDTYITQRGGDTVQLLKTKEFLEKLYNVKVEILTDPEKLDTTFDIAHVFNLSTMRSSLSFMQKAKEENIKIVLSPIYWDYSYAAIYRFLKYFNFILNLFTVIVGLFMSKVCASILQSPGLISPLFRKYAKKMIKLSDVLIPNSVEEAEKLIYFTRLNSKKVFDKIHIAPNAVDCNGTSSDKDIFSMYSIPKQYILQVGRIEFIKNQIQTVKALEQNPEIPIVFIGRSFDEDYATKLRKIAQRRGNVFFIAEMPHEDVQLFYKYALLHILPSLRESPGLVSLEALSHGCKIVVSSHNFTPYNTYFNGMASICNPLSISDIHDKILQEIKTERNVCENSERVKLCFSWENAAKETYKAYCSVLNVSDQCS
jgi:glycosyltransferase involved in cell wall biosynthesis